MKHRLPDLPYEVVALEPVIDTRTVQLHHSRHHAGYVAALNDAAAEFPQLAERSATWLLANPRMIPDAARPAILAAAGGHVNHSLFWRTMTPTGHGEPFGRLADAIASDFGSFAAFKSEFEAAGVKLIGSGWVWLTRVQKNGTLRVVTTRDHGNPMTDQQFPLVMNDVWEHAYYLKHQNRRIDYLREWWSVVDWDEVARRFARSDHHDPAQWSDGDPLLLDAA
jgi:Fe-Mn family superoxide dismutase